MFVEGEVGRWWDVSVVKGTGRGEVARE